MFSFKTKYKRKVSFPSENEEILDLFEKELLRLKVDTIERFESEINFKNKGFGKPISRWALMAFIDKGTIKIKRSSGKLEYSFSMIRIFYFSIIPAVFMGFFSQKIRFGIFGFIWLFGMNYLIALIRHNSFINKLKRIAERN